MRLLLITSCVCLITACGLKGPLYLPPPEPDSGATEAEQAQTQRRDPDKGVDNIPPPATH
jgi:predicted small lipoprotein YifL